MKKSRKFISMPVISLEDGREIGRVKGLVINPNTKKVSALLVEERKWFKEQKIVPFLKIRSIGDDAITVEKNNTVQKPANLPEMVSLVKENIEVIGAKVIAENGITLGFVEDFYVHTVTGEIVELEIGGKLVDSFLKGRARLSVDYIKTIGKSVLVAVEGADQQLEPIDGGLSESLRNIRDSSVHLFETTWEKTRDMGKNISRKLDSAVSADKAEQTDGPAGERFGEAFPDGEALPNGAAAEFRGDLEGRDSAEAVAGAAVVTEDAAVTGDSTGTGTAAVNDAVEAAVINAAAAADIDAAAAAVTDPVMAGDRTVTKNTAMAEDTAVAKETATVGDSAVAKDTAVSGDMEDPEETGPGAKIR